MNEKIAKIKAEIEYAVRNNQHETAARLFDQLRAELTAGIPLDELETLCEAWRDKRVVMLPKPESDEYAGLKVKYRVYKAKDNTPVDDCFVLRPDKDHAAKWALMTYAAHCGNDTLSMDIFDWVGRIEAAAALKGEAT